MKQLHFIHSEAFMKEPWTELAKLETFLNLPHEITKEYFYFSKKKGFYCMRQPYEHCMDGSRGHSSKGIATTKQQEEIKRYFHKSIKKLYKLINKDLQWS